MDSPLLLEEEYSEEGTTSTIVGRRGRKMMSASLQTLYRDHCIYLPAMLGWFVCSAALTSYNKVVFGENHANFPCPLLLTGIHFLVQWVFSYTVSSVFSEFFGGSVIKNMSWKAFLGEKSSDDDQSYHHLIIIHIMA